MCTLCGKKPILAGKRHYCRDCPPIAHTQKQRTPLKVQAAGEGQAVGTKAWVGYVVASGYREGQAQAAAKGPRIVCDGADAPGSSRTTMPAWIAQASVMRVGHGRRWSPTGARGRKEGWRSCVEYARRKFRRRADRGGRAISAREDTGRNGMGKMRPSASLGLG